MRIACALLILAGPFAYSSPEGKEDLALIRSLKNADVVFTAKIGTVTPLAQAKSKPPVTLGEITFTDIKALTGKPEPKYSYSYREGTTVNMILKAEGEVLVVVTGKDVSAIVPASIETIGFAKKVLDDKLK